jgi:8-oxo-dGTP pyrophosphatase MutT (NUDIX family)
MLAQFRDVFTVDATSIRFRQDLNHPAARTEALDRVVATLAERGHLSAWRDERYTIATRFGAAPLCLIERAAARFFGLHTYAAHVNGLIRGEPVSMWVARRSCDKAIDPGLLDNLVGGGIPAGASVAVTMVRESWEEAGIPAAVAATATLEGELRILRALDDGLQRETVFVHDLWLDADFVPMNQDGETVEHRAMSLEQVAAVIANDQGIDVMTADASLVALDFLLRHGTIDPDTRDGRALASMRYPSLDTGLAAGLRGAV